MDSPVSRRDFIKTLGIGGTGLALGGCTPIKYFIYNHTIGMGDMYEFRKDKQPFDIYFFEEESPSYTEAFARQCAEEYTGEFKEDLMREFDYKNKRDSDYIKRWMNQTNEFLGNLSGGSFQLELENVKEFLDGGKNPKYDELTAFNPERFRMVVTSELKNKLGVPAWYKWNGLFYLDPFDFQIDSKDNEENTYSHLPLHEILAHGFCWRYESMSRKSIIKSGNVGFIGLTEKEADHLDWPHVEPAQVHPLTYWFDRNNEMHVKRI